MLCFFAAIPAGAEPGAAADARNVGSVRLGELIGLDEAAQAVIAALPAGHRARDDLKALRNKLHSLRDVAAVTAPLEWDSMMSALLSSKHYGEDDLMALLDDSGQQALSKLRAAAPEDLQKALQFGAKVAAVTVSRPGANPPWAHEL